MKFSKLNLRNTVTIVLLMVVVVSCKKKEEEKDYRDVWCGSYRLAITEYNGGSPSTCGIGIITHPEGEIYYDKSMQEVVV